jgi:transcriptional regulator with XRE-family HTH domain
VNEVSRFGGEHPDQSPETRRRQYVYEVPPEEGLGSVIREERKQRNWTQIELAERVDLHQGQISAYERGEIKMPDPAALARLDDAFGWERGTLLGKAGWQGAKRRIESVPKPGELVVNAKGRPYLADLIEAICALDDVEQAQLLQTIRFMIEHRATEGAAGEEDASCANGAGA